MTQTSQRESGNIGFIILFGIAMFAALSFILTQNRDSNSSLITDQQVKLAAQDMIDYGDSIALTVQNLKLRGCGDTQLNFYNPVWKRVDGVLLIAQGQNPNAPATGCSVFVRGEGNLVPMTFPDSYLSGNVSSPTSSLAGHGRILKFSLPNVGTNDNDDLIYATFRVNRNVCKKINDILGVTNPSGDLPVFSWTSATNYNGSFGNIPMTGYSAELSGKTAFCAWNNTNGLTAFIRTLIAR